MGDEDPFYKVVSLAVSGTRRTLTARLVGVGAEGDDNAAEAFDAAEVMQPSGLVANPTLTATTEAFAVRRGDELVALIVADKGAAVQSCPSGETKLYGVGGSNAATVVRLRADGGVTILSSNGQAIEVLSYGAVTITAAGAVNISSGGGASIAMNGGVLNVARATDPVIGGATMLAWMAAVTAALGIAPPGTPVVSVVIPPVVDFGTILSGNPLVKA